jgi:hypothetical protein
MNISLWFIFNLYTTNMYIFYIQQGEGMLDKRKEWLTWVIVLGLGTHVYSVQSPCLH